MSVSKKPAKAVESADATAAAHLSAAPEAGAADAGDPKRKELTREELEELRRDLMRKYH
jgi:hypothetical protein